ncbi:Uncharacterized conserved protein YdeI, YjbR/CyaY-like superfamily, DUF1801 family [Alicyclobacillus hesperidum]|uniref:Uncharacterized conserved protein YdeI, YjbR/CyaY-like superfamily, DUF1801 family n=1 Tax=Alicyclobacillus hesperidum TaxID=89784 RepID=A0A1H2Q866_9BACL|nr:YdeI family protein [Alicyclobacillus hesperidum]SDW02609.1 Uncharacterized conserved protein YdeI, YjbR/CyaY-like superfamily, DUF1801 family [Alicyclobacillus hesperidum]
MTVQRITNPKVDSFFQRLTTWKEEFTAMRAIALDCGLSEELKWGWPCYTEQGKNIVLMHGFKEYCAFLFFKGALLPDPNQILVQQTENVQSTRQVRFTTIQDIRSMEDVLKDYIQRAIEVEQAGLQVERKKTEDFPIPEELQAKFEELPALKDAFGNLTPGRQRAYLLYFAQPKQSKTRTSRIEKYVDKILEGKGMND